MFSILFISLLHKCFIKRSIPNQKDLKKADGALETVIFQAGARETEEASVTLTPNKVFQGFFLIELMSLSPEI